MLNRFGFGQVTASGFPGESAGVFSHYSHWRAITHRDAVARLWHLGHAAAARPGLCHDRRARRAPAGVDPASSDAPPAGERVLPRAVCSDLIGLLEAVTTQEGATGVQARIPGYRVAGKTGTAWKSLNGGYSKDRYTSVFAGSGAGVAAAAGRGGRDR